MVLIYALMISLLLHEVVHVSLGRYITGYLRSGEASLRKWNLS